MCGIVDANVANEVFGDDPSPAGRRFFDWLAGARGQLVVGGELRRELSHDHRFLRWLRNASQYGRARTIPDEDVEERTDDLRQRDICKSNDKHVLALAIASGARLLYTNDNLLIDDFKNRNIVPGPPGARSAPHSGYCSPSNASSHCPAASGSPLSWRTAESIRTRSASASPSR